jgi:hypothetical protein
MRMGIAEIVDLIRTGFIPSDKLDEGEVLIAAVNEVRDGLEARVLELEQERDRLLIATQKYARKMLRLRAILDSTQEE